MRLGNVWVVQRRIGLQWLWWGPGSEGLNLELLHAGAYSEDQAKAMQRRRHPLMPNVYDHRAVPLFDALQRVRPNTIGSLVGLGTPL